MADDFPVWVDGRVVPASQLRIERELLEVEGDIRALAFELEQMRASKGRKQVVAKRLPALGKPFAEPIRKGRNGLLYRTTVTRPGDV
jgi:hypothetical protein